MKLSTFCNFLVHLDCWWSVTFFSRYFHKSYVIKLILTHFQWRSLTTLAISPKMHRPMGTEIYSRVFSKASTFRRWYFWSHLWGICVEIFFTKLHNKHTFIFIQILLAIFLSSSQHSRIPKFFIMNVVSYRNSQCDNKIKK